MTDKLGTPKSNEWRMPREIENELSTALRVNNPCNHTGFESFVCEVCGYPDPRKVLAALKRKYDALVAENSSLREALDTFSIFILEECRDAARNAREVLGQKEA